ncbi:hypothetical protein F5144DRAFT_651976 [Chaetomium tenue]|uniref:Uncharacterized protein n=1 Tax=Chaetomium tenue TaxID=1854479 RepID=A0ACB7P0T5_9PEZI|nr:hypothetical protein F5144DRAFT_651976 [Chaetomium globosum]
MASLPPPGSAGQEETPGPPGLPPTEVLESGLDPSTLDASLETRSLDPDPENTPPSRLPSAKPTGGPQVRPLKLETTALRMEPNQEPGTQSQTNVPRAAQQSQTPQTPVLGPAWRKRVIDVKNKTGSTRLKQPPSTAPTSQRPEASGLDNSKLAHDGDQKKTAEIGKAGPAKLEANPPERPKLVKLSAPLSLPPNFTIVAIPDIGQPLATAWAYTADKAYARRPGASSTQPPASADTTSGAAQAGFQAPPKGAASFRAGLKALEESNSHVKAPEQLPTTPPEDPTPVDKGKRRDDGGDNTASEDAQRGRRPLTPQQLGVSSAGDTVGKKPDADDRTSRHSNRPSSAKGSKPPSEKDKGGKSGNWLTDRTMLPYDVQQAEVWGFDYKPLETTQFVDNPARRKADYDKYLRETAEALMSSVVQQIARYCPQVFVATGFGCLIVQQFIRLISPAVAHQPYWQPTVLFFDPPSPILKEKPKTEKLSTVPGPTAPPPTAPLPTALLPTFPAPGNSTRANKLRAILESKAIDSWGLWEDFHSVVKEHEVPVVWFYNQAQIPNPNGVSLLAAGVDFVMLTDLPPAKHSIGRLPSRFRGPVDPNYLSFVGQLRRCLVLIASRFWDSEELLIHCIDQRYNLGVKDAKKRSVLHIAVQRDNDAAVARLVTARPSLVIEKDGNGATPLHAVIFRVLKCEPRRIEAEKPSYMRMIEKLLSAMAENQYDEEIKDSDGNSAWYYISVLDLRENNKFLLNGARAAQPEEIFPARFRLTAMQEDVCLRMSATLAQFYISNDGTSDFLEFQRQNVYAVVYDHLRGMGRLFERNLRRDDDKRATCRWVYLPANNELWPFHLFSEQLRRLDKSTAPRRHLGTAPFNRHIIPGALRYKQTYVPHPENGPTPVPSPSIFSNTSGDGIGTHKKTVTALFIPVFGYETHRNRKKLTAAMKGQKSFGNDETALLIGAYFPDRPLHCRRTLDQFTYHMLDDTERRDNTQVMSRWTKKELDKVDKDMRDRMLEPPRRRRDGGHLPVLMVAQLWLWILEDEQTVITSLLDTWDSTEDYNLVRHIMRRELMDNDDRPLIKDCTDLANSIIRPSVDFLNRLGPLGVTLIECFQSSITLVAERQASQFEKFKGLVRNLNQDGIDVQRRAILTNDLFQFTTETRLLAEIMDIQDELKTIHEVFLRQRDALKTFAKLMSKDNGQNRNRADDESDIVESNTPESAPLGYPFFEDNEGGSSDLHRERMRLHSALHREGGRPKVGRNVRFADERAQYQRPKARNQAEENLHLVESNITTIREMTTYAEKVRIEANAWEARFAREGSEHTQRQSNITLVFTAVTVLFLPLSFMSSVFAIQIDAFPHNAETGEVNWPLRDVMGLLFGLSLGTIVLVAFFGFYINRISQIYTQYFGGTTKPPRAVVLDPNFDPNNPPHQHHHHDSDSDSDSDIKTNSNTNTFITTSSSSFPTHNPNNGPHLAPPPHYHNHHHHHHHGPHSRSTLDPKRQKYAPLFGRWHFHAHIPLVRNLWRWRYYRVRVRIVDPFGGLGPPSSESGAGSGLGSGSGSTSGVGVEGDGVERDGGVDGGAAGLGGDDDGSGDGGGDGYGGGSDYAGDGGDGGDGGYNDGYAHNRPPSVQSLTSWGDQEFAPRWVPPPRFDPTIRLDYPLRRARTLVSYFVDDHILKPLDSVAPSWLSALLPAREVSYWASKDSGGGKEKVFGDGFGEHEEGGGAAKENSIRPSTQRDSLASGTEESWQMPEGPLRRRRTQEPKRSRGATMIVSGLLPWRWRRKANEPTAASSSEDGGASVDTSVDVALDPHEDSSAGGRQGRDNRGGQKGVGLAMLPSFKRKKGKEDDPKSGNRSTAWAGKFASNPSGGQKS